MARVTMLTRKKIMPSCWGCCQYSYRFWGQHPARSASSSLPEQVPRWRLKKGGHESQRNTTLPEYFNSDIVDTFNHI